MSERERPGLPTNRVALVGLGVLLGAVWGVVMWGLTKLTSGADLRDLLYVVVTMAMIGGGVAAMFGAVSVRRPRRTSKSLR